MVVVVGSARNLVAGSGWKEVKGRKVKEGRKERYE